MVYPLINDFIATTVVVNESMQYASIRVHSSGRVTVSLRSSWGAKPFTNWKVHQILDSPNEFYLVIYSRNMSPPCKSPKELGMSPLQVHHSHRGNPLIQKKSGPKSPSWDERADQSPPIEKFGLFSSGAEF